MAVMHLVQGAMLLVASVLSTPLGSAMPEPASAMSTRFLRWRPPQNLNRDVNLKELNASLQAALRGVHGGGCEVAEKLAEIEDFMRPGFESLPKTSAGRILPEAASYLAHQYFTRAHQWHLRGLGRNSDGMAHNVSSLHEVSVLQEKTPGLVASLIQAREAGRGLTIADTAAMAATLHGLIMDDANVLLNHAYLVNDLDIGDFISSEQARKVLMAFAIISRKGPNPEVVRRRLARPAYHTLSFAELGDNVARTLTFPTRYKRNPFKNTYYSPFTMVSIVQRSVEEYGKWQNSGCQAMKAHLVRLDPKGSGRVPIQTFWAQPDGVEYNFSESIDYLRKVGAMDMSIPSQPRVLISNYILGPANCYASSTYYQFCCLSECDGVVAAIEQRVRAPAADVQTLMEIVGNQSTSTVEAPRNIPEDLAQKLNDVAAHHGGKVPIHGRLFAQWLHFAFPVDCPYPHPPTQVDVPLTPSEYIERHSEPAEQELEVAEPSFSQWTDDELVLFQERPRRRHVARDVFAAAAALAVLVTFVRSFLGTWRSAVKSIRQGDKSASLLPWSGVGKAL